MLRLRKRGLLLPALVATAVASVAIGCGSGGGSSSKSAGPGGGVTPGVNTTQGNFAKVGALATARKGHSATLLPVSGKVLVVGGLTNNNGTDVALDSAEIYDPATGLFSPVQSRLTTARSFHATAASKIGAVLIAGGQSDAAGATPLTSVEVFNEISNTFGTATGALSDGVAEAAAFTYPAAGAERFVVAGGRGQANTPRSSAYRYSADSNPSLITGSLSMLTARYGHKAIVLDDASGTVLLQGGFSNAVEIFAPARDAFETGGNLSTVRYGASLAKLNGQVIVIGGAQSGTSVLASIEVYDATSKAFTVSTAQLITARYHATAISLQNGDVLLIGGVTSNGAVLNTTEVLSWNGTQIVVTAGPALQVARQSHTATLLRDGNVLIVGGADASGAPIPSTEVFTFAGFVLPTLPIPTGASPVLSTVSPNQGPVGTNVKVSGTNLSLIPAQNIVRFGNLVAPVQSIVDQGNGTYDLTVVVPQNAATGLITVANPAGTVSNGLAFTVTAAGNSNGNGGTFNGPPRLWIVLPATAPAFIPVGLGGQNFDAGTVPYFASTITGPPLFNWGLRNIPLIGSVSIGFTLVPSNLPVGTTTVEVDYLGVRSNQMSFEKTTW